MTFSPSAPDVTQPARSSLRMIAIASGKGGVGKTWLAISIAHALAQRRRNVLLIDGDLGLANVDIQLGLMPKHDLAEVLDGRTPFADAATHYLEGGFKVLAGRSGSGRLSALPADQVVVLADGIRGLKDAYDHIILDLGAGVDRTVRQFSRLADSCVVVVTGEPTSLTDAYAFIKLSHQRFAPSRLGIVVNMATSIQEGQQTYGALLKACETFLGVSPPLLGIIRRDAKVQAAIRQQVSLLTRFPACDAATDVEAVVSRLIALEDHSRR